MTYFPLFVFGTARSGSTILAKVLDAHGRISVASDPFFMLFRMFRNAAVAGDARVAPGVFCPESPLQDYYFRDGQLSVMQAMLDASLEVPCDGNLWESTLEQRAARLGYECPDLVPLLSRMQGATFRELLTSGLDLVATGRGKRRTACIGVKEVWLIEYVLPLLRAWPNAKVVVITRDPRGVVASMRTMKDAASHAHVVSYLRHWRKFAAFLSYYRALGLFGISVFHVRFEDFVRNPEAHCEDLCRFLGVEMDGDMLNPGKLLDYATGSPWKGNASSEVAASGVSAAFTDTWRQTLDPASIALCEFIAGPDMRLCGYAPVCPEGPDFPVADALRSAMEDERREHNWRSDSGDLACEFGLELYRNSLLRLEPHEPDEAQVRRAFLFMDAWRDIRSGLHLPCNRFMC